MASPKDAVAAEAVDREVPPPEKMAELRDQGPVSAAIADLYEDARLDRTGLFAAQCRVRAEALAEVGEATVEAGKRTVTVSDVHVDDRGMLVCNITHPDIPDAYPDGTPVQPFGFGNPPVLVPSGTFSTVSDERGERLVEDVKEDVAEAFRQIIRDAVASVLSRVR